MRAATVVQQLCKSCITYFMFYCMFYFTCDRSLNEQQPEPSSPDIARILPRADCNWSPYVVERRIAFRRHGVEATTRRPWRDFVEDGSISHRSLLSGGSLQRWWSAECHSHRYVN